MKLLISAALVADCARIASPLSTDVVADSFRIIGAFREVGHSPLTRKDLHAVLLALGWAPEELGTHQMWCRIGEALKKLTPLNKGYYTLDGVMPLKVEAPKKVAKPAPVVIQSEGPTLTSIFLEKEVRDNALSRKVAALLKRQYKLEELEDLQGEVNVWFAYWGRRGTCDEFIRNGKPPTVAILTHWVSGKLTQRLYRSGQDALTREVNGARTQGEVSQRKVRGTDYIHPEAALGDPGAPKAILVGDEEEGTRRHEFVATEIEVENYSQAQLDVVRSFVEARHARAVNLPGLTREALRVLRYLKDEPSATTDELRKDIGAGVVDVLTDLEGRGFLRASGVSWNLTDSGREGLSNRYGRYFDYMIRGLAVHEVVALESDSEQRVGKITQRVRADLRAAPEQLQLAMRVLRAIHEEPFSSPKEIEETVSITSQEGADEEDECEVDSIFHFLRSRELAEEVRGTYRITTQGERQVGLGSFFI